MQFTLGEFGEAQHLCHFRQAKQIVGRKMQARGEREQAGMATKRRVRQHLRHADDSHRRHDRQRGAYARHGHRRLVAAGFAGTARRGSRSGCHAAVQVVHHVAKRRGEAIARAWERNLNLRRDAAGIRRQNEDTVAHEHRLLDVMGHQQDRFDGQLPRGPQIDEVAS